jgi:nicotinamidase-related amidase
MPKKSDVFLTYVENWFDQLPALPAEKVFQNPEKTAILSVDMINGFCREGSLASSRIEGIIPEIIRLMTSAYEMGVREMLLLQDCHTPDANEFKAYAPHAVCGSSEAATIDEIKALPFFDTLTLFTKNSIDASQNTGLKEWIEAHRQIQTFVLVGNCTDICAFELANYLRAHANAFDLDWRVIVPEACVQTYDLPVATAMEIGAVPHDGDLLHRLFLHQMYLNGVEVVKSIK